MVTTFSLLLLNFGLNGFTEAVIQTAEINDALVSNLFWINLGFGALLTVAFARDRISDGKVLPGTSGGIGGYWDFP